MIEACINLDGKRCLLKMDGHATGSEAVCAGASAIVYALAGYLLNAGEHLETMERNALGSGNARIFCVGDESVQAAFHMAGIGLAQLAQQYPEYIRTVYLEE